MNLLKYATAGLLYTAKDKSSGECEVVSFEAPDGGAGNSGGSLRESTATRAGQGQFDARASVRCAEHKGQPMDECDAGVARDPGCTATVVVTRPDGRTRGMYFEKGKATGADLSQADGYPEFRATKESDLNRIRIGNERYEIPDSVVLGG